LLRCWARLDWQHGSFCQEKSDLHLKTTHPKRRGNRGIRRQETPLDCWIKLKELRGAGSAFQYEYIMLRNRIAEENYDLVNKLAELMHYKHPEHSKEDLKSYAAHGLMDAINKYDPGKGNKFETFATYRLFGSMYDEMRKSTWSPRLVRQRQAILDVHREKFVAVNGRQPNEHELICALTEAGVEKPDKVVKDGTTRGLISIFVQDENNNDSKDILIKADIRSACVQTDESEQMFSNISREIGIIAGRVCSMIYAENMSEEEVSKKLEIGLSDVVKIHKKALKKLKTSEYVKMLVDRE